MVLINENELDEKDLGLYKNLGSVEQTHEGFAVKKEIEKAALKIRDHHSDFNEKHPDEMGWNSATEETGIDLKMLSHVLSPDYKDKTVTYDFRNVGVFMPLENMNREKALSTIGSFFPKELIENPDFPKYLGEFVKEHFVSRNVFMQERGKIIPPEFIYEKDRQIKSIIARGGDEPVGHFLIKKQIDEGIQKFWKNNYPTDRKIDSTERITLRSNTISKLKDLSQVLAPGYSDAENKERTLSEFKDIFSEKLLNHPGFHIYLKGFLNTALGNFNQK